MLHKRKPQEDFKPFIEEPEVKKPPKSVKPLSQKHFKPIMEEVSSLKPMMEELKAEMANVKAALDKLVKTDEEVHEEIKPE
jgi:hypothetical protein